MDEIKAETELPVMRGRLRSSTKADGCSLLLTLNLYKQKQNKKKSGCKFPRFSMQFNETPSDLIRRNAVGSRRGGNQLTPFSIHFSNQRKAKRHRYEQRVGL